MKKIFQIAAYDFRRIMLNPITMVIIGVLMAGCLILGSTYKMPVTPTYSAVTEGESSQEIYENFLSSDEELDTKSSLDKLLKNAQNHITVMENESPEYKELTSIKEDFDKIEDEFRFSILIREPKYIKENSISEIVAASNRLKVFVQQYEKFEQFGSKLVFTKENFAKLKGVSDYFSNLVTSGKSVREVVLDIYQNTSKFSEFSPSALTTTWWADEEQLENLQTITNKATKKATLILAEITTYTQLPSSTEISAEKVRNLITSYKLTCESADFVVKNELTLLMSAHFGNLDKLFGYETLKDAEDVRQNITKANFFIDDESLYYTAFQEPLNFNVATNEITAFDNAYFLLSIIGFLATIFGIFCAYKLFGRDRKNGKMDLILSQNVTYSQVFAGKFTAIVFCTTAALAVFLMLSLLWSMLFYPTITTGILAIFNLKTPYVVSPFLFLIMKFIGIELQVIFWAVGTIFLMNISRKFELTFAIALAIFAVSVVCNIFLNGMLVYCLFPFVHVDLTAFLGGGSMSAGFLQTALYSNGNFYISLAYYLVVVVLLYNFTNQLFKKN